MKIPFKTATVEGDECVMAITDMKVVEARFNMKTKEFFILGEVTTPAPSPKKPAPKKKVTPKKGGSKK